MPRRSEQGLRGKCHAAKSTFEGRQARRMTPQRPAGAARRFRLTGRLRAAFLFARVASFQHIVFEIASRILAPFLRGA
jgi:hypothetical protein